MKFIAFLVRSKVWVALAAGALTYDSYRMLADWVQWTLVAHVFFLTWMAYLFLDYENTPYRRVLVPLALTGVLVTFRGFDGILWLIVAAVIVLLYRSHWIDVLRSKSFIELRRIPLINNLAIAACWLLLCIVWPCALSENFPAAFAYYATANFLLLLALSMCEDLFSDTGAPDATLYFLGEKKLRLCIVFLSTFAWFLHVYKFELSISMSLTSAGALAFGLFMKSAPKTALKSWVIDGLIVLRFWN